MTDPQNPTNWSDPTYQPPPPPPVEPWPGQPVSGTTPETGYTYGAPAAYPTTAPAYPAQPYYPQPGYPAQPGYPGAYGPAYVVAKPTNGLAVAAMVCALAGFVVGISFPVGAILGHVARKQIRQTGEQGEGFALTGIIVGWIGTGLFVLCCGGYLVFFIGAFGAAGLAGTANNGLNNVLQVLSSLS
jgi:hypothetical protein